MKKFLNDGIKEKDDVSEKKTSEEGGIGIGHEQMPLNVQTSDIVMSELNTSAITMESSKKAKPDQATLESEESLNVPSKAIVNIPSIDSNKPKPKKAKLIRLERKIGKLAEKGLTLQDLQPITVKTGEKSLEDFLAEEPLNGKHQLKVCDILLFLIN